MVRWRDSKGVIHETYPSSGSSSSNPWDRPPSDFATKLEKAKQTYKERQKAKIPPPIKESKIQKKIKQIQEREIKRKKDLLDIYAIQQSSKIRKLGEDIRRSLLKRQEQSIKGKNIIKPKDINILPQRTSHFTVISDLNRKQPKNVFQPTLEPKKSDIPKFSIKATVKDSIASFSSNIKEIESNLATKESELSALYDYLQRNNNKKLPEAEYYKFHENLRSFKTKRSELQNYYKDLEKNHKYVYSRLLKQIGESVSAKLSNKVKVKANSFLDFNFKPKAWESLNDRERMKHSLTTKLKANELLFKKSLNSRLQRKITKEEWDSFSDSTKINLHLLANKKWLYNDEIESLSSEPLIIPTLKENNWFKLNEENSRIYKFDPYLRHQSNSILKANLLKKSTYIKAPETIRETIDRVKSYNNYYYSIEDRKSKQKSEFKKVGKELLLPESILSMGAYTGSLMAADKIWFKFTKLPYGPGDIIDPMVSVPDIARGYMYPTLRNRAVAYYEMADIAENFIPYNAVHINVKNFLKGPIEIAMPVPSGKIDPSTSKIFINEKFGVSLSDRTKFDDSVKQSYFDNISSMINNKYDTIIKYNEKTFLGKVNTELILKSDGTFKRERQLGNKTERLETATNGKVRYTIFKGNKVLLSKLISSKNKAFTLFIKELPHLQHRIEETRKSQFKDRVRETYEIREVVPHFVGGFLDRKTFAFDTVSPKVKLSKQVEIPHKLNEIWLNTLKFANSTKDLRFRNDLLNYSFKKYGKLRPQMDKNDLKVISSALFSNSKIKRDSSKSPLNDFSDSTLSKLESDRQLIHSESQKYILNWGKGRDDTIHIPGLKSVNTKLQANIQAQLYQHFPEKVTTLRFNKDLNQKLNILRKGEKTKVNSAEYLEYLYKKGVINDYSLLSAKQIKSFNFVGVYHTSDKSISIPSIKAIEDLKNDISYFKVLSRTFPYKRSDPNYSSKIQRYILNHELMHKSINKGFMANILTPLYIKKGLYHKIEEGIADTAGYLSRDKKIKKEKLLTIDKKKLSRTIKGLKKGTSLFLIPKSVSIAKPSTIGVSKPTLRSDHRSFSYTIPDIRSRIKTSINPALSLRSDQRSILNSRLSNELNSSLRSELNARLQQKLNLKSDLRTDLRTDIQSDLDTDIDTDIDINVKPKISSKFRFHINPSVEKKILSNPPGIAVVVRDYTQPNIKQDKVVAIGTDLKSALSHGQNYVDETPSTSFSIAPTNKKGSYATSSVGYKFTNKHGRWYELNKYRFDRNKERNFGMQSRKRQRESY